MGKRSYKYTHKRKRSLKRSLTQSHKRKRTHKHKRSHKHKSSHSLKRKRTYKRMRGGSDYAAYPAQAYAAPMAGNGLNQIGPSYNVGASNAPSGNHYAYNSRVESRPEPSNPQTGGRRKRKGSRQRGGGISSFISGIVPDEIMNLSRSVPAGFGHFSDKFNGLISTPSSMVYPTQQPLVGAVDTSTMVKPVNIKGVYDAANSAVAGL